MTDLREVRAAVVADPRSAGAGVVPGPRRGHRRVAGRALRGGHRGAAGRGLALVAVGGHGRGELAPGSDLDLWLLHDPKRDGVAAVADRLWYPIWDAGVKLGHAVRTPRQALALADGDLDTATAALGARLVAGDPTVVAPVLERAPRGWRAHARRWLPALSRRMAERAAEAGEVAFLLEPDLKEGRGGLRDIHALRWVEVARPVLRPGDEEALAAAEEVLLDVRVALHRLGGRAADVLLLERQDDVAAALGEGDADVLVARVAEAARTVAWTADEAWGRVASSLAGPSGRLFRRDRVARSGGPAAGGRGPGGDRGGRGRRRRPRAAGGRRCRPHRCPPRPRLPRPAGGRGPCPRRAVAGGCPRGPRRPARRGTRRRWPSSRPSTSAAWWSGSSPSGPSVRGAPAAQRPPPLHRRPPPLRGGRRGGGAHRHGAPPRPAARGGVAARHRQGPPGRPHRGRRAAGGRHRAPHGVRRRRTSPSSWTSCATTCCCPRWPPAGTCPTTAWSSAWPRRWGRCPRWSCWPPSPRPTRCATGPGVWSPWKAELLDHVGGAGGGRAAGRGGGRDRRLPRRRGARAPAPSSNGGAGRRRRLLVVAPDRPGVVSRVAGALALRGLAVLAADAAAVDGMAAARLRVEGGDGAVDWDAVAVDVRRALDGRLALEARLAERSRVSVRRRAPGTVLAAPPSVRLDNAASDGWTVVEVRAPDRPGAPLPDHPGHRRPRPRARAGQGVDPRRRGGGQLLRAHRGPGQGRSTATTSGSSSGPSCTP